MFPQKIFFLPAVNIKKKEMKKWKNQIDGVGRGSALLYLRLAGFEAEISFPSSRDFYSNLGLKATSRLSVPAATIVSRTSNPR